MVMAPTRATRADYRILRTLTTRWNDNDIYGRHCQVVFPAA
jgi:hypothetical protein